MSSETEPVIPDHIRAAIHAGHVGRIVIFCDRCNLQDEADYTGETKEVRLAAARKHLTEKGWRCDVNGDLCPACATAPAEREQEAPAPQISDGQCVLRTQAPTKPDDPRYDVRAAMEAAIPPFSFEQSTSQIVELVMQAAERVMAQYDQHLDDLNNYYTDGIEQGIAECERRSASCEAEVRRKVAGDIEALDREPFLTKVRDEPPLLVEPDERTVRGYRSALRDAARIARGES